MNEIDDKVIYQMEKMREIRRIAELNRKEFSEYMGIPVRTIEEWESGRRKMPDYVLRLIEYQVRLEKFLKEKGLDFIDDESGED